MESRSSATRFLFASLVLVAGLLLSPDVSAQSLQPSRASLDLQNQQARMHEFTYLQNPSQVRRFVNAGLLVEIPREGRDYYLNNVSFPFARPEVKTFIERLGAQFRAGCGEKLVVTSLTRPQSHQPPNASRRSVHPTGMAIDLRRAYDRAQCRDWLDRALLRLENEGVLEVAVERYPPHYHMALFPEPYAKYARIRTADAGSDSDRELLGVVSYEVRNADTLWDIARTHGTTPAEIRAFNRLSSDVIHPGQVLDVPTGR